LSNTKSIKTHSCSTSGTRRFNLVTIPNYLPVVSSRMFKFLPCTRPGRLSTTKHVRIPKRTVGIIDPLYRKEIY